MIAALKRTYGLNQIKLIATPSEDRPAWLQILDFPKQPKDGIKTYAKL